MTKAEVIVQNQAALIWTLEVQVVHIPNLLSNRPQGSLSSNNETNPKDS